jgi:hypothetical protein
MHRETFEYNFEQNIEALGDAWDSAWEGLSGAWNNIFHPGTESGRLSAMPEAVQSMADHLGFMFGYGAAGMPGFPDPYDRHDPKKPNYAKTNAQHIKNSLEGIQRNLGKQDLRTYLENALNEKQYTALTQDLDYLVTDLQSQEWFYQQIGPELSSDILGLLKDMGYILGP